MDPVDQAREGVRAILDAYQRATTADQREGIARLVSCLTPTGALSLAEMADRALAEARPGR